ncbi:MAG: hypothetical protein R3F49_13570 [Planctomycetota bacterium]
MPSNRTLVGLVLCLCHCLCLGPASSARAQVRFVDGLPGTFIDIAATGTPLPLPQDGEADITTSIGNTLLPAGTVRIGANGGMRFGATVAFNRELAPTNTQIPNITAFGGGVALLPYWDSFQPTLPPLGTTIPTFYQELGDTLIVQWSGVVLAGDNSVSNQHTFQVQVHRTGDVFAQFLYPDIEDGNLASGRGATIGFQGSNIAGSVQYSFNAPHAVRNGTVLSIVSFPSFALVDGLPGSFVDISASGTSLQLANDDEVDFVTSIRNDLLTTGTVRIASNGGIRLGGTGADLAATNAAIPSSSAFGGDTALLPFWDDINTLGGTIGNIFAQELPGRLVVQWDRVAFTGSPASRATFQVQLFHESDVAAQFLYADINGARAAGGASATVGYQAGGVLADLQFSFAAPTLHDGDVLSIARTRDIGANYCDAAVNSTGQRAAIVALGSNRIASNTLFFEASSLPLHSAAFFIVGTVPTQVPNAGGSAGTLCVGGITGRGVGGGVFSSGAAGVVTVQADLTAVPIGGGTMAAQAGSSMVFQCWFRDAVGGVAVSNFTDATQLQFKL